MNAKNARGEKASPTTTTLASVDAGEVSNAKQGLKQQIKRTRKEEAVVDCTLIWGEKRVVTLYEWPGSQAAGEVEVWMCSKSSKLGGAVIVCSSLLGLVDQRK